MHGIPEKRMIARPTRTPVRWCTRIITRCTRRRRSDLGLHPPPPSRLDRAKCNGRRTKLAAARISAVSARWKTRIQSPLLEARAPSEESPKLVPQCPPAGRTIPDGASISPRWNRRREQLRDGQLRDAPRTPPRHAHLSGFKGLGPGRSHSHGGKICRFANGHANLNIGMSGG